MNMPTHIVAVAGLVKDNHGNVLIGWSNWRKQWEFFGGQVENGENLEEALLREIKEETGITAKVISLAGIYSNIKGRIQEDSGIIIPTKVMLDFVCEYVSGQARDSDETTDVQWVPVEKAVELIKTQPFKLRLQNMLHYDGRVFLASYQTRPFSEGLQRWV